MQVHVTHTPVMWMVVFGALLLVGLVIAVGAVAFAIARRRGSGGGNVALVSAAAIGLCLLLMLILAGALPVIRQSQENARRVETQTMLHRMGEELHARDAFEQARRLRERGLTGAAIPIEADRPQDAAPSTETHSEEPAGRNPLPEWVSTGNVEERDRTLVVISGEQFADPQTARDNAMSKAERLVRDDFEAFHGATHEPWSFERELDAAVRNSHTEEIRRTAGENEFTVFRTHLLVELSPAVREALEPIWRQQVGRQRSVLVAALLAFLTAIAGVVAGYVRLVDRTAGRHRWPLRLAAVTATLLIGGTLLAGSRLASQACVEHPVAPPLGDPVVAPSEAPTSQIEASGKEHVNERFREVADHMVKSINAADYEGLRQDFNDNMLDKFPVEKCETFFTSKISDQYGEIEELETPQFKSAAAAVFLAHCERGTLDFTLTLDEYGRVAGMLFQPGSEGRIQCPLDR